MGNKKDENRCDMCANETSTCFKLYGKSVDDTECFDINEDVNTAFEHACDNARILYDMIISMSKSLGIRTESELLATVALVLKSIVVLIADGDEEKSKEISNRIGKTFQIFN